jgi:uncharacterized protein YbaP (TraB family)
MRRFLRTALAVSLLATSTLASSQVQTLSSQPTTVDADPALWVMKDEDTTIYLFGTVHILKPGLSWFDEEVLAAFERSDELVTEIVTGDPAEIQAKSTALGVNRTGPALSQKLRPKDRAAYLAAMKQLGVPFQAFERFDPWMASMALTVLPLVKQGYDPNSGAEKVLETAASGSMKKHSALETLDEQLGFFDGMSPKDQIAFLNATVAEIPKSGAMIGEMITAWGAGKPDDLAAMMNRSESMTPSMTKLLLTDRNARWAEKLDARMDRPGTIFVAVGAGHLAGKDSVQAMLQARGFKVERVEY